MGKYPNKGQAGLLLDDLGCSPSKGLAHKVRRGRDTFVDGPFTESKELVVGYTLIERSESHAEEEAIAWSKRFRIPRAMAKPAEIEVRQLFNWKDFAPSLHERVSRELGVALAKNHRLNSTSHQETLMQLQPNSTFNGRRCEEEARWSFNKKELGAETSSPCVCAQGSPEPPAAWWAPHRGEKVRIPESRIGARRVMA